MAVLVVTMLAASCSGTVRDPVADHHEAASQRPLPAARAAGIPTAPSYLSAQLAGVSCASRNACVAAGSLSIGGLGAENATLRQLAQQWDGSAWRAEQLPAPDRFSELYGVSCATAGLCVAVGTSADLWAGGRWRVLPASRPYRGVSCAASDWCMAVGVGLVQGHPVYGLWNGRSWAPGEMPEPAGAVAVDVTSVSCVSFRFCIAVGTYSVSDLANAGPGNERALAELWDGTGWQTSRAVSLAGLKQLAAVSCISPQACTAIGTELSDPGAPAAQRWDGTGWLAQVMPTPGGPYETGELTAVSCATATACVAVGSFGGGAAAAELWDGSVWRAQQVPAPGPFAGLSALSCPTSGWCMAVGSATSEIDWACGKIAVADVWNGRGWRSLAPWSPTQCFPP